MEYIDPYGIRPPPAPVQEHVLTLYQGDTLEFYRMAANPDGSPATPETCHLEFTVVSQRFSPDVIFQATWEKNIARAPNVGGRSVRITIPSEETAHFLRGPFLYSLVWRDRLNDRTITLEEGGLLVEYAAGAPDPEVPYNSSPEDDRQDQTYGFIF